MPSIDIRPPYLGDKCPGNELAGPSLQEAPLSKLALAEGPVVSPACLLYYTYEGAAQPDLGMPHAVSRPGRHLIHPGMAAGGRQPKRGGKNRTGERREENKRCQLQTAVDRASRRVRVSMHARTCKSYGAQGIRSSALSACRPAEHGAFVASLRGQQGLGMVNLRCSQPCRACCA